MTSLYEESFDLCDTTEVHWSTGTILAVFFAASLVSAVFFGLGYSFGGAGGAKSVIAVGAASTAVQNATSDSNLAASSGSSVAVPHAAASASQSSGSVRHVAVALRPAPVARTVRSIATPVAKPVASASTRYTALVASRASQGHIMVQVGAIVRRNDADRLVAQLRKKGFYAGIYRGKHDKFLHVQIGPYKNEQQAKAMRHRLAASGYSSILKSAS